MEILWPFKALNFDGSETIVLLPGYNESQLKRMTNEPWTYEMYVAAVLDRPWGNRYPFLLENAIRNSRRRRRLQPYRRFVFPFSFYFSQFYPYNFYREFERNEENELCGLVSLFHF